MKPGPEPQDDPDSNWSLPTPGSLEALAAAARAQRVDPGNDYHSLRSPVSGGNHRGWRLGNCFLKQYYPPGGAEPMRREFGFGMYAWSVGAHQIARPIAAIEEKLLVLFQWVDGEPFKPGDPVGMAEVAAALAFFALLNPARGRRDEDEGEDDDSGTLEPGAEACFSIREHLDGVGGRVGRVAAAAGAGVGEAAALLEGGWEKVWVDLRSEAEAAAAAVGIGLDDTLPPAERCVSPSDFGFHNAIRRPGGELCFIDFEHAGMDDPAKLVADFFFQPEHPVPERFAEGFAAAVADALQLAGASRRNFLARVRILRPVYGLKWACIVLNPLLPGGPERRRYAAGGAGAGAGDGEAAFRAVRLERARGFLRRARDGLG